MNKNLTYKTFHFKASSVTQEERNGVPVGIIKGYASTWGIDRGNDQIMRGAFQKSIDRHVKDNRQIRMYDGHDTSKLIGGYPIDKVKEDENGLYVEGEVNLSVQRGAEVYALAKQGVLCDFSIGFSIPDKNSVKRITMNGKQITQLNEIELWEISPVSEPMNKDANILAVKSFGNLPIAPRETKSNFNLLNLKEDEREKVCLIKGSDALTIGNMVDGVLTIIPKMVFISAGMLLGVKGSLAISDEEENMYKKIIEEIYKKMNLESPFGKEKIDITILEACETQKDVEQLLKWIGFTDDGRKILTRKMKSFSREGVDEQIGNDLNKNASALEMVSMGILMNTLSNKR